MSTLKELTQQQHQHIKNIGGYISIKEADNINNDLNRKQIQRFLIENGNCYLGKVNYHGDERKDILNGEKSIYKQYNNEDMVYNFGCDFCVPEQDTELENLIKRWNKGGEDYLILDIITDRIESLKGINFIWS